jgi:H+/Cl- antiporter ClcA
MRPGARLEDAEIVTVSKRAYRLRRPQTLFFSRRLWRRRLVFWGGAIVTGLVGAGFAIAANRASHLFDLVTAWSPWIPLLLTPLGFLVSALACRRVFPGAQGSGIPQAIAARHVRDPAGRDRLLSLRLTVGKIFLTLFGLACGASIGREGPTVQVGASIMLQAARLGGMGRERGLILAGSAAGVAAAFNTPLAGIVFAIEEMGRSYEHRTNGLILSTVILAGIASIALLGNYSYFGITDAGINMLADWPAVIVCGLGGGVGGACFSWLVLGCTTRIRSFVMRRPDRNVMLVAALAGLVVAILGILSHGATYGTGYEQARGALEGTPLAWTYAPMKLLATLASTLSGIPGGIFAPSLSVGAGMGSALAPLFPGTSPGALVVLGMAGYFAGVVQAPITAFVIIIEMTADHGMVIPLMVAAVLGFGTSRLICPQPLYHTLAEHFIETARAASSPEAKEEQE